MDPPITVRVKWTLPIINRKFLSSRKSRYIFVLGHKISGLQ